MKKFLIGLSVLLVLLFSGGCYKSPVLTHTPRAEAEKGCELNDAMQCYILGLKYSREGLDTEKDYLKAKKYYLKTVELNAGLGYKGLGDLYFWRGYEFPKDWKSDYPKARKYYHKACEFNNPSACYLIAKQYMYGSYGVKENNSKAEKYLLKACNLKLAKGCFSVGLLYEQGRLGTKPDYLKAIKYYRKSCDISATGCHRIKYLKERIK